VLASLRARGRELAYICAILDELFTYLQIRQVDRETYAVKAAHGAADGAAQAQDRDDHAKDSDDYKPAGCRFSINGFAKIIRNLPERFL
jgi:hypothetical protein